MQVANENETLVTEFILVGCSIWIKPRTAFVAFIAIAYLIGCVGNGIVIMTIVCDPRLHNPMFFFLCNLSIVDFCMITTVVPQSIAICLVDRPVMTFPMCFTQTLISLTFAAAECYFLTVMAYDRYIAISSPLHYMLIMNKRVCIVLAFLVWITAFFVTVVPFAAVPYKFCGSNVVNHFVCEFKAIYKLICLDTSVHQILIYATAIIILICPLCFISFSYLRILLSILMMNAEGSKMKAFSTCGSHLAAVAMYFSTALVGYSLPQTKETHSRDLIITVVYGVLTPMLNPLIYALRSREILGALKRPFQKKR